ncbi:MAG: hypothetical protein LBR70_00335 [Lactobacillaceae bacterium]|jgi:SH3-like domain-containing protein|nr:hypothetical protein [Lactobacillaceae bacterium]
MKKFLLGIAVFLLAAEGSETAVAAEAGGGDIPRMVSIRSNRVNARSGPGARYPIEWVYLQKDTPVEIIAEFEVWRKVKDWQGSESWVHKSMLSGKRTVKVITPGENNIYAKANYDSKVIAKAEDDVVGEVKKCQANNNFCLIKFNSIEGWVSKNNLFGIYPKEIIN